MRHASRWLSFNKRESNSCFQDWSPEADSLKKNKVLALLVQVIKARVYKKVVVFLFCFPGGLAFIACLCNARTFLVKELASDPLSNNNSGTGDSNTLFARELTKF